MTGAGLVNPSRRAWRWRYFTPSELSCRCGRWCDGEYFHDPRFLDALDELRRRVGRPLHINSARRCVLHNAAVGGAPRSMHRLAIAADIDVSDWSGEGREALLDHALDLGFTGIGFGRNFLHLDRRKVPTAWEYARGGAKAWTRSQP